MAESCDKVPQSGEGGEEGGSVADVQAHAVLILLACACDSSYRETRETSFNNQQTLEARPKGTMEVGKREIILQVCCSFCVLELLICL